MLPPSCMPSNMGKQALREFILPHHKDSRIRKGILLQGMGVNWRWGEALFRCMLVDYDPASNMGNWRYVAGDNHDPRGAARQFRTVSQGMKYDASAELISRWLPELGDQTVEEKHQPWVVKDRDAVKYPKPLLDPRSQLTKADQSKASDAGR